MHPPLIAVRVSRLLLLSIVLGILWASAVAAVTVRVPGEQATIQLGIDATSAGDTVLVAPGTYSGAGNKNLDFGGRDIVLISESGASSTIIDCEGSAGDNARGFIFQSGESGAAVVSGFTIRNGYLSGGSWPDAYGAGVLVGGTATRPTIKLCHFENNVAEAGGGGFASAGDWEPVVDECRFTGNSAQSGGGAFASSDAIFTSCEFIGNTVSWQGGGLMCMSPYMITVTDCLFEDNSADGGGGLASVYATAIVSECRFERNTAGYAGGGGVLVRSGGEVGMSRCLLVENSAQGAPSEGGAVICDEGTVALDECTLYGNFAASGAGLYGQNSSTFGLSKTIIAFNVAGEAVADDGSATITLSCCDLFGNDGGDWVGSIAAQAGVNGNISADPFFCDVSNDDFSLAENSPCAPPLSGACGRIGAYDTACPPNGVEAATWGGIKAAYRR